MLRNRSIRRGLVAVALLVSVPAALAASAAPASASISPGLPAPPIPGLCEPSVVKSAELVKTVDGPAILVTGIKFQANATVRLDPQDIQFVQQPDYFPYDVNSCGAGPFVKTPYTALFKVPTAPVGRFGISIDEFLIDLFPHI